MPPVPPEPRPYVSPKRAAAAEKTKAQVIAAAQRLLEEGEAQMSLEAVAKAAGVTRLTVYKQFGSRRGLLEAVFDDNARRFGITRMAGSEAVKRDCSDLIFGMTTMAMFRQLSIGRTPGEVAAVLVQAIDAVLTACGIG